MKLAHVIEELIEEKGLDKTTLSNIICEGILVAYARKYPELELKVDYDKKTDDIAVKARKTIVSNVVDKENELSLRKARFIDPNLQANDEVWLPFEGKIGRIEILRAKQVIASKIRAIEAAAIYNQFKDKKGTIVHGFVHKCEHGGATVKIDDTLAFLPKSLMIPGDKCIANYPVRALLKDVLVEPRNDNQLILDRISVDFLNKLFELEIPEVFEKLVEIKKIVRIPGYKAKVAVASHDKNIDPVGTCVGVGGVRIKPILRELGSEKVDIIAWSSSVEELIRSSLKPAIISRVELLDDKNATVWLDDDQRSLAIGKMGQNIALASQLTDINIHLSSSMKKTAEVHLNVDSELFEKDE